MPWTKSAQRSKSLIAEPPRMAEPAQLGDVPAEEERHGPVGQDAQFPRDERKLVEVIRTRDEPADEPAERDAEDERDPLVAAERGHLSEHPEAVRLLVAAQVLREPASLPKRVL